MSNRRQRETAICEIFINSTTNSLIKPTTDREVKIDETYNDHLNSAFTGYCGAGRRNAGSTKREAADIHDHHQCRGSNCKGDQLSTSQWRDENRFSWNAIA